MVDRLKDRHQQVAMREESVSDRWVLDSPRVWRLLLVLTLVPLAVSAVSMFITVGNLYHPWSDYAVMEMRVRDVGHHPVLLGLYSRDGWSHPGPILFYLLAVPYRLTGDSEMGLQLGALLVNGSAIAGMAVLARRRGGTPLFLCTMLGCGLMVRTLGPDFVRDPWVCYIPVIPFGLLVLLCWSMACGDAWALPVGAGVGSFLAQTHIGYLALAPPLLAWGAVSLAWRAARRQREPSRVADPSMGAVARAAIIAAVVIGVMWLPAVIDQVFHFHSPGNISRVLHWFQKGKTHSLAQGARVVGAQFGWPPEWLTHRRPAAAMNGETSFLSSAPTPVLLVPLTAAGFVVWRRQLTQTALLLGTVAFGLLCGVVAVARTVGIVYDYRLGWTWVPAMLAFVVAAWTAWQVVVARSPRCGRWLAIAAVGGLVVLSVVNTVSATRARISPRLRAPSSALAALEPKIVRALPDRKGDVIIRATSPIASFYKAGLLLRLERQGFTVRVDANPGDSYGSHRNHRKAPVRAVFIVALNADVDALLAQPGRFRLLGYEGDRTRAVRARMLRRRSAELAHLDAEWKAGKLDWAHYVRTAMGLRNPGRAVAVFEAAMS